MNILHEHIVSYVIKIDPDCVCTWCKWRLKTFVIDSPTRREAKKESSCRYDFWWRIASTISKPSM